MVISSKNEALKAEIETSKFLREKLESDKATYEKAIRDAHMIRGKLEVLEPIHRENSAKMNDLHRELEEWKSKFHEACKERSNLRTRIKSQSN